VLPCTHDGQPAPGLRFDEPRVPALLAALCAFGHLLEGLTSCSLRTLVGELLPRYTPRQLTYHVRRLRRKGLIRRLAHSQHYELTPDGRRLAVFSTTTTRGSVRRTLAELDPQLPDTTARRTALGRPGANSNAPSTTESPTPPSRLNT
jgi:hypothetical protein